jgi:hypothetical protein
VILAMIRNGGRRESSAPPTAAAPPVFDEPPPLVVIGEKPEPQPEIIQQTSVIMVPYLVPARVGQHRPVTKAHVGTGYRGFGRFINDGWVEGRPPSGAR